MWLGLSLSSITALFIHKLRGVGGSLPESKDENIAGELLRMYVFLSTIFCFYLWFIKVLRVLEQGGE